MFKRLRKFDPIVHLVLLIGIVILFSLVFFMHKKVKQLGVGLTRGEGKLIPMIENAELPKLPTDAGSEVNIDELRMIVSEIISTISATPRTITQKEVGKTSFITLGTSAKTKNTDWEDVDDAQVYMDLAKDFGQDAEVSWEASLKVAHGNGQAFARLYDDTNKIVVLRSEISTTNNSDFKQVSSANLNLWAGRNLYKVQLKSLNSFEATYSGGRIKVSY